MLGSIDTGRVWTEREYWYQLYQRTGESLRGRQFVRRGRLPTATMTPGRVHHLRVGIADLAGNRSVLDAPLRRSDRAGGGSGTPAASELAGGFGLEGLLCLRDEVAFDDRPPSGVVDGGAGVWVVVVEYA